MIWSTLIITAVRYDFKMILNTNYFIIFVNGIIFMVYGGCQKIACSNHVEVINLWWMLNALFQMMKRVNT